MITIKKVTSSEKKLMERYVKKEWSQFNKERGYRHEEKKFQIAAYEGKRIVGYASFKITGGVAHLSEIIVSKQMRHQSIGQSLLSEFEKVAKREGAHMLSLETSDRHREAVKFYKKNNYQIRATIPHFKFDFTWFIFTKEIPS